MITKLKVWEGETWGLVFDDAFDTMQGQVEIDCAHPIKDFPELNATLHCNCGEDHPLHLRVCTVCGGYWLKIDNSEQFTARYDGDMIACTPRPGQ